MLNSLKPIDKFALKYCQDHYTYDDFLKEKETKTNINYALSEESENSNIDDELDLGPSDDEEKIDKLDLDQAYEMYMSRRSEIRRSLEQQHQILTEPNITTLNNEK
jgi:hypothetical protein